MEFPHFTTDLWKFLCNTKKNYFSYLLFFNTYVIINSDIHSIMKQSQDNGL